MVSAGQDRASGFEAPLSERRLALLRPKVRKSLAHRGDEQPNPLLTGRLAGQALLVIDDDVGRQFVDEIEVSLPNHLVIKALNQACPGHISLLIVARYGGRSSHAN